MYSISRGIFASADVEIIVPPNDIELVFELIIGRLRHLGFINDNTLDGGIWPGEIFCNLHLPRKRRLGRRGRRIDVVVHVRFGAGGNIVADITKTRIIDGIIEYVDDAVDIDYNDPDCLDVVSKFVMGGRK